MDDISISRIASECICGIMTPIMPSSAMLPRATDWRTASGLALASEAGALGSVHPATEAAVLAAQELQ